MHDTQSALTAWSNFYVIIGSSAAALTGLMFVVITLIVGNRSALKSEGLATFSTPTVVHFCAALLVSATLSAPWRSLGHAALMVGLTGLFGVAYALIITYRARRLTVYRPGLDDWLWYAILPWVGYTAIVAAAIALGPAPTEALFVLAGAVMLLIFIGIHNAWDIVTYLAVLQHEPAAIGTPPAAGSPPDGGTRAAGGEIGEG